MDQKIAIPITMVLLLIVPFALATVFEHGNVIYDSSNPNEYRYKLYKGWNLMILGAYVGTAGSQPINTCGNPPNSAIQYIWMYSPTLGKWGATNINEQTQSPEFKEVLEQFQKDIQSKYIGAGGIFAYSDRDCEITYSANPNPINLSELKLSKGWNLVPTTAEMEGKNFDEVFGNCGISKVYSWSPQTQQWKQEAPKMQIPAGSRYNVLAMKTAQECNLK